MKRSQFLDNTEKETLKFLQKLVATPSQNGIDPEKNVARVVVKKLEEFGLKPKLVGEKERPAVMCVFGKSKRKRLLLNAHLDTVPAGDPKKWKYPPFSAKIVGQRMYGRGTADSKAAIAIFCYLAGVLAKAQTNLNGQLILGFDSDEESGNFTGFKNLLKKIGKLDSAIIGYPGIDEIVVASRGFLRLKITAFGESAHTGSQTQKGINAILKMNKIISFLKDLKLSHEKDPLFWFGPKITVSQILGGRAINIVPDECSINVDIRSVPGQTKEQVLEEIEEGLKKELGLKFEISAYQHQPPFKTNPKEKIVKILKKNVEETLKKRVKLVASGGGGVGNLLEKMRIPIIGGFGVEFGKAHGVDEWISLDTLLPVAKIYLKTVVEFFRWKKKRRVNWTCDRLLTLSFF